MSHDALGHLRDACGQTDIYLLDQILKARFIGCGRVLEAGCGGGRNLAWFLRAGLDVCGIDEEAATIEVLRRAVREIRPDLPAENFRAEPIEDNSFGDETFGAVLCIAILHFSRDAASFDRILRGAWRVLKPGGVFFCRLCSSIGIESHIAPVGEGRYRLGDGSVRYLVDLPMLLDYGKKLGGDPVEPIKSVNVQNQRCMSTWILRKR